MKIVHINLSDSDGGAAKATIRLHKAMINQGVDSKVIVVRNSIIDDKTIEATSIIDREIFSKARYLFGAFKVRKSDKKRGLFSSAVCSSRLWKNEAVINADFIYLHWINHGVLNIDGIGNLLKLNKPVIWVAHDMWPATGGCHHALDCEKYKTECKYCPSLFGGSEHDLSYKQFKQKDKLYSKHNNLYFIAISDFMKKILSDSALTKDSEIRLISNAVDTNVFKPLDKEFARKTMGLDPSKKLILFGADMGVKNRYKGWGYLQKSLEELRNKYGDDLEVVLFGSSYSSDVEKTIPFKTHFMGKLKDETSMAMLYNAADVFVIPSIAESLSYTTIESISCGTPVVGFNVGGIPFIIRHKINGYLAENGNSHDLTNGIDWLLSSEETKKSKNYYRESVVNRFDSEVIAKEHIAFLNTL